MGIHIHSHSGGSALRRLFKKEYFMLNTSCRLLPL